MFNRTFLKPVVGLTVRTKDAQMCVKLCPLLSKVTTTGSEDAQAKFQEI